MLVIAHNHTHAHICAKYRLYITLLCGWGMFERTGRLLNIKPLLITPIPIPYGTVLVYSRRLFPPTLQEITWVADEKVIAHLRAAYDIWFGDVDNAMSVQRHTRCAVPGVDLGITIFYSVVLDQNLIIATIGIYRINIMLIGRG